MCDVPRLSYFYMTLYQITIQIDRAGKVMWQDIERNLLSEHRRPVLANILAEPPLGVIPDDSGRCEALPFPLHAHAAHAALLQALGKSSADPNGCKYRKRPQQTEANI